jgi:xanthine dehydrogenase YagS FAD-binding subunit
MQPITYVRASSVAEAVATVTADPGSAFLAGGTTEVDLLRLGVIHPNALVDINNLPLTDLEDLPGGAIRIGALARMSDVARAASVQERYPGMSQALLLGASEQLRNMASMGGNRDVPVQQAGAGFRVLGIGRREPGSRDPRHQRAVHRHAPVRRRGGTRRA